MKRFSPILFITIIIALLAITNYTTGTILTGWDNLHPEFYFAANIKRSLFAVWQEYQGLGLLGGMGHASDLLRQLFLAVLSLVIPISFLRYFWTLLTLLIGSLGAYFLTKKLMPTTNSQRPIAIFGALFYVLNLSTVQTYYVIFETFSTHFAALPWLLLTTIHFVQKQNRQNLVFLLIVLLLATPSAYVPTLFVVTIIAIFTLAFFLLPKKPIKHLFLPLGKLAVVVFLVNVFWLLPFTYFTLTNAQTNVNAKINQMATEEIFLKNQEFGNIGDVMLLKGFLFNAVESKLDGGYGYILQPWKNHLANPLITVLGYALFAIVLLGVISALRRQDKLMLGFAVLFVFVFTMLATATPPFSWIDALLRSYVPLFGQVFRFPFTKFSILASLTYAIFFAFGMQAIFQFASSRMKKTIHYSFFIIPISLLLIFAFPAFQGHLFYDKVRIKIPQEYFTLFDFFKNQDPNTRIANFPQYTFWSWNFYQWGYGGSGFLWYGIRQPILDRAFDVWSKTNENYYFELSQALYSKNTKQFEDVLNKYQITWLLVDKNIISPSSPKALFFPELEELIGGIPAIKKEATFGNIDVYKVALKDNPQNFVFTTHDLPTANSYQWNNNDQAYQDLGNYISANDQQPTTNSNFYPFRSLFSNKSQKDIEFDLKESADTLELIAALPTLNQTTLTIPAFQELEDILPVTIIAEKGIIKMILKVPALFLNDQNLQGEENQLVLFPLPQKITSGFSINSNGVADFSLEKLPVTTFVTLRQNNVFTLSDGNKTLGQVKITPEIIADVLAPMQKIMLSAKKGDILRVEIPKITDNYLNFSPSLDTAKVKNCDTIRNGPTQWEKNVLSAKNATACTSFYSPNLLHKQGYALFIKGKNLKGRGLHFWLLNEDEKFSPIDTYLPGNNKEFTQHQFGAGFTATFVIPPQESFGKGYTFSLDSMAVGPDETANRLDNISIYPIPYTFLTSLFLGNNNQRPTTNDQRPIAVLHPNESLYVVHIPYTKYQIPNTLILSQSFDNGWKAYDIKLKNQNSKIKSVLTIAFPFFFGEELKDHVLINNWENGWTLPTANPSASLRASDQRPTTIIIVYLPQYLEYVGFGLMGITAVWLLISPLMRKRVKS